MKDGTTMGLATESMAQPQPEVMNDDFCHEVVKLRRNIYAGKMPAAHGL